MVCYIRNTHTHAHTHPFNGPFSGTTRVSRYQKGKTNLDFTEARDSEWQWHQLGHLQVCISLQTDNHASTPPLKSFLQTGCPSCRPTNSVKALKAKALLYPKVLNNIWGDVPVDVPPNQNIGGCVPGIPGWGLTPVVCRDIVPSCLGRSIGKLTRLLLAASQSPSKSYQVKSNSL